MPKDYENMTNHELNLYLGEIYAPNADIVVDDEQRIFMDEAPFDYTEWNPCAIYSGQSQQYLDPLLNEKGLSIRTYCNAKGGCSVQILDVDFNVKLDKHTSNREEFNRIKVISILTMLED